MDGGGRRDGLHRVRQVDIAGEEVALGRLHVREGRLRVDRRGRRHTDRRSRCEVNAEFAQRSRTVIKPEARRPPGLGSDCGGGRPQCAPRGGLLCVGFD